MPAADRATLYNVEDPFEDAAKLVWASYSYPTPAFAQRECADLPAERVDFKLELGPAIGARENAWNARFTVTAWTRRDEDGRSKNGQLRGAIRDCFRRAKPGALEHQEFQSDRLPLHMVKQLTGAGSDPQTWDEVDQLDRSALYFDVVICCREDAFPA